MWTNYGGRYIAIAAEVRDYETEELHFVLSYHDGYMPAFSTETFSDINQLEYAMRKVRYDLRKWRVRND